MVTLLSRSQLLVDLIDVSRALHNGDDSEMLSMLRQHVNHKLNELIDSFDSGKPNLQSFDESQILAAMQTLNDSGDLETVRALAQRLETAADESNLDPVDVFQIKHISVKAALISGSTEEIHARYASLIASAEKEISEDHIHQLHVDYARVLLSRDLKAEYIAEIRQRLAIVSPNFQTQIGVTLPEEGGSDAGLLSVLNRATNKIKKTKSTAEKQFDNVDAEVNEANILQASGKNEEAFEKHMALAQAGVAVSQMSIGTYYQLGIGCDEDFVAAQKWYGLAAEQRNITAHLYLGALLQMGLGSPVSTDEAAKHYRFAAKHRNAQAYLNLGGMLASITYLDKPNLASSMECIFRAWEIDNNTDLQTSLNYYSSPLDQLRET